LCEEDDTVRLVVLSGNEKAFVAGSDIENMSMADIKSAYGLTNLGTKAQEILADLPTLTIAAISGYALGGGLELALCCDFRIASVNAILGFPEITLGIIPGGGGTQRLPRLVSLREATRLIFLGERINAEEAEKIGLVDKVIALNRSEKETKALAFKLVGSPPLF